MLQGIRVYFSHSGQNMRVMVVYESGAALDFQRPTGDLNPIQIDLPATDKGDSAVTITISRAEAKHAIKS